MAKLNPATKTAIYNAVKLELETIGYAPNGVNISGIAKVVEDVLEADKTITVSAPPAPASLPSAPVAQPGSLGALGGLGGRPFVAPPIPPAPVKPTPPASSVGTLHTNVPLTNKL